MDFLSFKKSIVADFPNYFVKYVKSLFPITTWITRYNLTWLTGDVIAGLTAGAVVIPQGLAYAKIASLPPEYGLYSSFVGVSIYCLFSTAKDITIGPTVVMSLLMSQAIAEIQTYTLKYSGPDIAASFSLFSGIIAFFLGIFRLGFIVDFIPAPVIAGFTTGSALTIGMAQLAKLFGISDVNTRQSTYLVLIDTLKALPHLKIDTILGIFCLTYLYGFKFGSKYLAKRYPSKERFFFFVGIFRTISIVIISTLFAFLINIGKDKSPILILKNVPSGFTHLKPAQFDGELAGHMGRFLPGVMLILILEHIAIAKCFGRINDYKINPSQELIAIGATNALGSFFGAYPTTGSFVRTAIKAKSGVRTPLAGIFSAMLVILALFVLTPAFYYIPDSTLAAVVIHAIVDLISGPSYVKKLWKLERLDLLIFLIGVIITIFTTVEVGIYASTGLALLILLIKLSRPKVDVLGCVKLDSQENVYVPLNGKFSFKRSIISLISEGILIFRINESLIYLNSNRIIDKMIDHIRENTSKMTRIQENDSNYWYQKGEEGGEEEKEENILKFLILDLSGVNVIDFVGMKSLLDLKKFLFNHLNQKIEYHFTNIGNEKIRNNLIHAGFKDKEGGSIENGIKSKIFFHLTIDEAIDRISESKE